MNHDAKYKQNNEPDCFREQMPEWEPALRAGDCQIITYSKDDWKNAPASFNEHSLEILGQSVMEDWETPYMWELASIATHHGGHILEIGFGMGISSRFIQEAPIEEHIIIEANYEVAQAARSFACNARHPVSVLEGLWEEVIDLVPDGSISGILFDSYPLVEEELYQNHFSFFPYAYRKLQGGGGCLPTTPTRWNLFPTSI